MTAWRRFSSVQFSLLVMSNSLWPHGLQHARLPCPSPTPEVYSNSCPLSQWCYSTISFSVVPFFSCLQSFPASGSFPVSQFFASGGQSIGVSASTSVLPMNIQNWFPLGLTGWISLQSKGLWKVSSNTTVQKHQFFSAQFSLWSNTTGLDYWKKHDFDWQNFVAKVISLLFSMLSKLVITFLSRSKHLLMQLLKSPSAAKLKSKKTNVSLFWGFPFYLPWSDGTGWHDLSFSKVLSQLFHSPLSISSWGS